MGGLVQASGWRPRVLALLTALATTAVWILVLVQMERTHSLMRQQVLAQAEQRSLQLADSMAGQVGGLLGNIDLSLQQLRREWQVGPERFNTTAQAMLGAMPQGVVSHVTVVDAEGYVVYNSLGIQSRTYVGDRPHFLAQKSNGADRLLVGTPVLSRLVNKWAFVVNRPLLDRGRFAGTVNMSVSSAFLSGRLGQLRLSGQDVVALLHKDGTFMARSHDYLQAMERKVPANRPFLAPTAQSHGTYRLPGTLDHQQRIYAWQRLPEYGLIMAVGLAEDSVLAPLEGGIRRDRAASLALLLLLAIYGTFITRLLLRADRRQGEIAASESFRKRVFDSSPIPIVVMDSATMACIDCNPAAVAVFGFSEQKELLGTTPLDVSPSLQQDGTATAELAAVYMARALAAGTAHFPWRYQRRNGQVWDADVHLMVFQSGPRRLIHVTLQDITEQKRAEEALRKSEERYSLAAQIGRSGAWEIWPEEGRILFDDNLARLLGYSEGELSEDLSDWVGAVPEYARPQVEAAIQTIVDGRSDHYNLEHPVIRKDGTTGWVQVKGQRISAPGEKPLRLVGSSVDISERKLVEEALELTQMAVESSQDGVFWLDAHGRVFKLNDQACRSLGGTRGDLIGKHVWDFDPDFRPMDWPPLFRRMRTEGFVVLETRHRRKDGSIFPVEITANYVRFGEQEYGFSFARDITDRKEAEEALRQDREQQTVLKEMMEITVRGGTMKDTLDRCLQRLMQVSWLALLPQGGIFLMDEDRRGLRLTVAAGLAPQILRFCDRVPLGHCHCGRAALSRTMQHSHCVDHRHDISYPGMADHGHYNLPLISEGEVLGVIVLYLPTGFVRKPAKEQFLTTVADLLAGYVRRKHAEDGLKQLNEQLEVRVEERTVELVAARDEAERASRAKSEFLSRMSHELRTPLNAILGFGQLLEMDIREDEQADNVREILHAGRHLLELINEVLDLARIESGRLNMGQEPVALAPLIEESLAFIRPMADARGIGVTTQDQGCGEVVLVDRIRLKQVLINLLSNAVKYNSEQGRITVACANVDTSVRISISDTGAGLTPEQQARLFSPFERLDADKHAIEGTGIGLALSKRLTELMGGRIGVESTAGEGSTFWVQVPLLPDEETADSPSGESALVHPAEPGHASETRQRDILYIEDNPANMRLVESILARRQDIRLLTAYKPSEGLELARAHQPALVLLDISLPEMDGYEVLRRLRADVLTRDIPVVAVSANAMPSDLDRGKAAGFQDYLTKPLEVDELLRVVDGLTKDPSARLEFPAVRTPE